MIQSHKKEGWSAAFFGTIQKIVFGDDQGLNLKLGVIGYCSFTLGSPRGISAKC